MTVKKMCYLVLLGVLGLFIVQNMTFVTVSFLLWEFTLPRSVLLVVAFALGIVAGYGLFEIRSHQQNTKNETR